MKSGISNPLVLKAFLSCIILMIFTGVVSAAYTLSDRPVGVKEIDLSSVSRFLTCKAPCECLVSSDADQKWGAGNYGQCSNTPCGEVSMAGGELRMAKFCYQLNRQVVVITTTTPIPIPIIAVKNPVDAGVSVKGANLPIEQVMAYCGIKSQCYNAESQQNFCTDLNSDDWNCGACENHCRPDQKCIDGICGCENGYSDCSGFCTDTSNDPSNCGACANKCPISQGECINGKCILHTCDNGLIACYGSCIDPQTDDKNCGGCGGYVCGTGTKCVHGACNDFKDDSENCGSAGNQCGDNASLCCNGHCVDPFTDSRNCGSCDTMCETGKSCRSGNCVEESNKREMFATSFESLDQKVNQIFNILASILKNMEETRSGVVRNFP